MKKITLLIISLLVFTMVKAQCNEPTNIHLLNQTYSVSIQWDYLENTIWDIEYGENGFTPTGIPTIENLNYPNYNVDQMPHSIYYDFYVRTDCDTETSNWIGPITFYNYCLDYTYSDIFENFGDDFIPYCWTEAKLGNINSGPEVFSESNWERNNFANTDSNLAAKINLTGTTLNDWLILPAMTYFIPVKNINSEIPFSINFDIALTQHNSNDLAQLGTDDTIELLISPDLGNTWYNIHTWDNNSTISNITEHVDYTYEHDTDGFDLFDINFLIAFRASSGIINDSNVDFFIDNINAIPPYDSESSSINDLKSKGFSYYPNPIKNTLHLNANENIDTISIYNYLGQEVKTILINSIQKEINLNNLEKGVYFMNVKIGNTTGFVSLIKE